MESQLDFFFSNKKKRQHFYTDIKTVVMFKGARRRVMLPLGFASLA